MADIAQLIGETIGSYKILDILGEGGMGAVYKAEHVLIGKKVALKMLHAEYAQRPEIVQRFFTEARAVNKIGHQNIVDISDYGHGPDGRPYFIMELLEGMDLAREIEKSGPIELARALNITRQVASALSASHQAGIIHRDLKPENILLVSFGKEADYVKVLDFGIAKLLDDSSFTQRDNKTKTGVVIGTPAYMAPEQAGGREVDYRADLYSLGLILYEMLTGTQPFTADTFSYMLVKILTEEVPRPRTRNPNIPPAVEAVLLKVLSKEKEARHQSAIELLEDLARAEANPGEIPPEEPLVSAPAASPRRHSSTTLSGVATEVPLLPQRKTRVGRLLLGGAAALGVAVGAFFLAGTRDVTPPTSALVAPTPKKAVTVEILSVPEGATVTEGDTVLGVTPLLLQFPVSEEEHSVSISAEGYLPRVKSFVPRGNVSIDLALAPKPSPETAPAVEEAPAPEEEKKPKKGRRAAKNARKEERGKKEVKTKTPAPDEKKGKDTSPLLMKPEF